MVLSSSVAYSRVITWVVSLCVSLCTHTYLCTSELHKAQCQLVLAGSDLVMKL